MTTTLQDLPVAKLHASSLNPRKRIGDVSELADSIAAKGLLEPLVVVPADRGRYTIIAGHRRHAAAKKAGLTTVSCLIRDDLTEAGAQLEAMLVENLQRADLTPVEEAEAYEQLLAFGYTQTKISDATGRSKRTVSDRLRILRGLTETSRTKLHKGQINLAVAADLLAFEDHPDLVASIEREAGKDGYRWALSQAKTVRGHRQRVADELAAAVAAGEKSADWPAGVAFHQLASHDGPLRLLRHLAVDDAEHKGTCPHHVVVIDPYNTLERGCAQGRDLHPAYAPGGVGEVDADEAEARRAAERQAKDDDVAAEHARATWAAEQFTQTKPTAPATLAMLRVVAAEVIHSSYSTAPVAAALMGMRKPRGKHLEEGEAKTKLTALVDGMTAAKLIQLITVVTVVAPAHRGVSRWSGVDVARRLRALEALGYPLTDHERGLVAAREPREPRDRTA